MSARALRQVPAASAATFSPPRRVTGRLLGAAEGGALGAAAEPPPPPGPPSPARSACAPRGGGRGSRRCRGPPARAPAEAAAAAAAARTPSCGAACRRASLFAVFAARAAPPQSAARAARSAARAPAQLRREHERRWSIALPQRRCRCHSLRRAIAALRGRELLLGVSEADASRLVTPIFPRASLRTPVRPTDAQFSLRPTRACTRARSTRGRRRQPFNAWVSSSASAANLRHAGTVHQGGGCFAAPARRLRARAPARAPVVRHDRPPRAPEARPARQLPRQAQDGADGARQRRRAPRDGDRRARGPPRLRVPPPTGLALCCGGGPAAARARPPPRPRPPERAKPAARPNDPPTSGRRGGGRRRPAAMPTLSPSEVSAALSAAAGRSRCARSRARYHAADARASRLAIEVGGGAVAARQRRGHGAPRGGAVVQRRPMAAPSARRRYG